MDIELYLNNQRIDIDNVNFPLNKTFEELTNPSLIVTDYSKQLTIPRTRHNDKVIGNCFKVDKLITDDLRLGIDPSKKIPFRLMYNNDLLMNGYAKFNKAAKTATGDYYNITLYGKLGEIFQELLNVVTSESRLGNKDKKYLLNDGLSHKPLDLNFLYDSWHNYGYLELNNDSIGKVKDYYIVGLAPSYRGLYKEFDSNKIDIVDSSISYNKPITDRLKTISLKDFIALKIRNTVKQQYPKNVNESQKDYDERIDKIIDSYDFSGVVKDGLKEYQMCEYRLNQQKPYIYVHSLFELYKIKLKELTGYDLVFDKSFCNSNNPYWSNACKMFDFFPDAQKSKETEFIVESDKSVKWNKTNNNITSISENVVDFSSIGSGNEVIINPINITINSTINNLSNDKDFYTQVTLADKSKVNVFIKYKDINGNLKTIGPWYSQINKVVDDKFCPGKIENVETREFTNHKFKFTLPTITISNVDKNYPITYSIETVPENQTKLFYWVRWTIVDERGEQIGKDKYMNPELNNENYKVDYSSIIVKSNWRTGIDISLGDFYKLDTPLFQTCLDYTKIFGLMWVLDEYNKILYLTTKASYFKDYRVIKADNRIDYSKDFIVEPVSFQSAYVKFNYEKSNGAHYNEYYDEFGATYGELKLKTSYEFDTDDKELFEKLQPSCSSNRVYSTIFDFCNWKLKTIIPQKTDFLERQDSDDKDNKNSISISNFYFRGDMKSVPTNPTDYTELPYKNFISIDLPKQLSAGKFNWIDADIARNLTPTYCREVKKIPEFTIAYKKGDDYFGLPFNCPNKDFTANKNVTKAYGSYVFDRYWKKYINERYNIQNKKLTCYMRFSKNDWVDFQFRDILLIQNQLWMINKIFDYNPVGNESTRVELIQITDINAYTI